MVFLRGGRKRKESVSARLSARSISVNLTTQTERAPVDFKKVSRTLYQKRNFMIRYLLLILLMVFSFSIHASIEQKSLIYEAKNFEEAESSKSYFRFEMQSSLFGFITVKFPGFAKEYTLQWRQDTENKIIKDLKITIPVMSMDTDKESRTEEMQLDCLEVDKFKEIIVTISGEYKLAKGEHSVQGIAKIRGKNVRLNFKIFTEVEENSFVVSGAFPVRLKDVNINNPTIAKGFASFNDEVKLSFNFLVP